MYCRKCGCKIYTGEKQCSDCGTYVSEIEYSGGFWGLVGEQENEKTLPPIEDVFEEDIPTVETKQNKFFMKMFVGVAAILLALCMVQTVRVSMISKKYKDIQMKYGNLDQHYQELTIKYDGIMEELSQDENAENSSDDSVRVSGIFEEPADQLESEDVTSE